MNTVQDSLTMLRRSLRHTVRNPVVSFGVLVVPVVMLLLFVYVLGGAFDLGSAGASAADTTRSDYLAYVVPGIVAMSIAFGTEGTALGVATDTSTGIADRFRTMAIARASVLTGHVGASVVRCMVGLAGLMALTLAIGFRPEAGPGAWAAAVALTAGTVLALSWVMVAIGLSTGTVEGASFATFPITFLPFLSSAFVPTESMPAGVRAVADHQPFTPIIETLRSLLLGGTPGDRATTAAAWCVALAAVGYLTSRRLLTRATR